MHRRDGERRGLRAAGCTGRSSRAARRPHGRFARGRARERVRPGPRSASRSRRPRSSSPCGQIVRVALRSTSALAGMSWLSRTARCGSPARRAATSARGLHQRHVQRPTHHVHQPTPHGTTDVGHTGPRHYQPAGSPPPVQGASGTRLGAVGAALPQHPSVRSRGIVVRCLSASLFYPQLLAPLAVSPVPFRVRHQDGSAERGGRRARAARTLSRHA